MKKKGFTLVELLAVIVIMAVLALIAIPITVNIISDSRENAHKRSIESYGRSVENAYLQAKMDKTKSLPNNLKELEELGLIKVKGEKVVCDQETPLYDDGKINLTNCMVVDENGKQKSKYKYNYTNGKLIQISEKVEENEGEKEDDKEEEINHTAVSQLKEKTNGVSEVYTEGSEEPHQMYAFEHPVTEQTDALTDYRYIGNDPYNYVDFNGETWRIIGIFTVEDESGNSSQRIKIIKEEKLSSNMAWNSISPYENDWTSSTLNAYLNGDYYTSLSDSAKSMIEPSKIYLGGRNWDNVFIHYGTAEDMYAWERGTAVYSGGSFYDINNITLIYPSDYAYTYAKGIDRTCYLDGYTCTKSIGGNPSKGWLYKSQDWWTVSSYSGRSNLVFHIDYFGSVSAGEDAHNTFKIRPVAYLQPSVKIASGTGTNSDPYKLKK